MIERHSRLPALAVLGVVAWAGLLYGYISRARAGSGGQSIEQIERMIANEGDTPSVATWTAYAQALSKAGKMDQSSVAWRKVIEIEPSNREAKVNLAVTLASAGKADEYFAYIRDLIFSEAKLAKDVMAMRESQVFASDKRFAAMQREARAQSMD